MKKAPKKIADDPAFDASKPSLGLLLKLGSIVVHADEITEDDGENAHEFDYMAIRAALADPEVILWIREMSKSGFLPVKRK